MSFSSRIRFSLKKIKDKKLNKAVLLYFSYLAISIIAWILNKFVFGNEAAIKISEFSQNFGSVITSQESFGTFFLKSFVLIFTIYSFIIVIQSLSCAISGSFLYLILALLVGLASGAGFGGGLVSYLQGNGVLIFVVNQLEWLAGALLISAIPSFDKIHRKNFLFGTIFLLISIFLNSLISSL